MLTLAREGEREREEEDNVLLYEQLVLRQGVDKSSEQLQTQAEREGHNHSHCPGGGKEGTTTVSIALHNSLSGKHFQLIMLQVHVCMWTHAENHHHC